MKNSKIINEIFFRLAQHNPKPVTELRYINNFTLTVAVVLSAQATDISVNKATKTLFETHSTPSQILALGEKNLKQYIKSIGLYNAKAKNIIALCQILVDKYNSVIPDQFDELIKLPGIGRKTANVILNCAFNQPTIAVDTHVYRVSRRLGLSAGNTPDKVERDLISSVPKKWAMSAHHWLILHGRYKCKARKPLCDSCVISDLCDYDMKTIF